MTETQNFKIDSRAATRVRIRSHRNIVSCFCFYHQNNKTILKNLCPAWLSFTVASQIRSC